MEPKSASFRETTLTLPTPLFLCVALSSFTLTTKAKLIGPSPRPTGRTARRSAPGDLGPRQSLSVSASETPGWRPQPRVTLGGCEGPTHDPPPSSPPCDHSPGMACSQSPLPSHGPGEWAGRAETSPTKPLVPVKPVTRASP